MKEKKPGDHIILRLKNTESPLILEWINSQSNLSDSIRYLVEEEIKAHSVRDLQEHIPAKRKPLEVQVETAVTQEIEGNQRVSTEKNVVTRDKPQSISEQNLENEPNLQVKTGHQAIGHQRQDQEETSVHPLPEREEQSKETAERLESVKRLESSPGFEQASESMKELGPEKESDPFSESEGDFRKKPEAEVKQEKDPESETERKSEEREEEEEEFSDDIIDHWLNI